MNEKYEEALALIKNQAGNLDMLRGFPEKLVAQAITAWPFCYQTWVEPTEDWLSYTVNEDQSKVLWIWDGVLFDEKRCFMKMGPSYKELMERMIAGFLIYPDGDYLDSYLIHRKMEEANG